MTESNCGFFIQTSRISNENRAHFFAIIETKIAQSDCDAKYISANRQLNSMMTSAVFHSFASSYFAHTYRSLSSCAWERKNRLKRNQINKSLLNEWDIILDSTMFCLRI